MRKYLCNKIGAGHVDTAIKIIIGVVIGALILGGLYLLFAGDRGVVDQLDTEIVAMMDYRGPGYRLERAYNKKTETFYLRYSYDGKTWCTPEMPDYGDGTTVYGLISNNSESDPIEVALLNNGTSYYVLTSQDGGLSWQEQLNFTASAISHFYYGTSDQLPNYSASFANEQFVVRYQYGVYFTVVSNGYRWVKPTWSDLTPLN